jgi:hypothetical protein
MSTVSSRNSSRSVLLSVCSFLLSTSDLDDTLFLARTREKNSGASTNALTMRVPSSQNLHRRRALRSSIGATNRPHTSGGHPLSVAHKPPPIRIPLSARRAPSSPGNGSPSPEDPNGQVIPAFQPSTSPVSNNLTVDNAHPIILRVQQKKPSLSSAAGPKGSMLRTFNETDKVMKHQVKNCIESRWSAQTTTCWVGAIQAGDFACLNHTCITFLDGLSHTSLTNYHVEL